MAGYNSRHTYSYDSWGIVRNGMGEQVSSNEFSMDLHNTGEFNNFVEQNSVDVSTNAILNTISITGSGVNYDYWSVGTIRGMDRYLSSQPREFRLHSRSVRFGMGLAGGGLDEQGSNISMQEVATGVGAFALANGVKGNLVEWGMKGADWGKAGARYVKYVKRAGVVGFVANVGISSYSTYDYYRIQNGTGYQVGAKATLDVAMGGAAFFWPIGTAISGAYFILDASTDGFGGWGNPYKP